MRAVECLAFDDGRGACRFTVVNADVNVGKAVKLTGNLVGRTTDDLRPRSLFQLMRGDGPTSGAVWNWSCYLNGVGIATFRPG